MPAASRMSWSLSAGGPRSDPAVFPFFHHAVTLLNGSSSDLPIPFR
jgi:hypothetical protein